MTTVEPDDGLRQDEESLLEKVPFRLSPTNLKGGYAIPEPSLAGDPFVAGPDELVRSGILWPQPDENDHPSLKKVWARLYSRQQPIKWLTPELHPQIGKTHLLRVPARKVTDTSFVGNAWSGVGIRGGGPWTRVFGMWQIPAVTKPAAAQGLEGGWNSSSWVGIDGFDLDLVSTDVLQGGVQQQVDANGNASYVAWFEWFAPPQANSPQYIFQSNVPSLTVSPGDMVFCLVSYFGPLPGIGNMGNVLFFNMSTNAAFAVLLFPPPGATNSGNTIEWIMEAPDGGEPNSSLPEFTPVVFLAALGSTRTATNSGNPAIGDTLNIANSSGKVLTSVTAGPALAVIDFIG